MTAGRKTTPVPTSKELAINEATVRADFNAVAALGAQEQERVTALAEQIGYVGSLTVGALEDEIRFYQRQTVEAILQTGKRLLLLKEMTPHGEFVKRAELLGFHAKTAQRFMQAALKTSKSDKLSFLSAQVKNGSAFLELVTHDDDELTLLDGMDDVDRMSASQLRAALRKAETEKKRDKAVIDEINTELMDLKLERKVVAHTDWPDALVPLTDQVALAGRKIAQGVSELEACRIALFAAGVDLPEEDRVRFEAAIGHVADVYEEALARAERSLEKERLTFDQTLGGLTGGAA
jgi:hypothetical protein